MSPLNRIIPAGTKAQFYVLRSAYNGKFVKLDGGGYLVATESVVTPACFFALSSLGGSVFALLHRDTQKWVSAQENDTSLRASRNGAWQPDTWEKFEANEGYWDWERYGIAIRSLRNNRLAGIEGDGRIRCNRDYPGSGEHFRLMPVFDMSQVVTGFINRYPSGMCKERTKHFDNSGLGWMNTGKVFESRVGVHGNQLAVTFMSPGWLGTGEPEFAITDLYVLHTTRVGLAGDYVLRREGGYREDYTNYGNRNGVIDGSMIAMFDRYMTPDMAKVYTSIASTWTEYKGPNADQNPSSNRCYNFIDFIGERDTGNGVRWIISTGSDPRYPNESGHSFGFPYEMCYFDLGPNEGVFDPAFGFIGYKQMYVQQGSGTPTGQMAEEYYAKVVPGSYHRQVGSLFQV